MATQNCFSGPTLRRAMAFGTVMASFTISGFSLEGLASATRESLDARWEQLKRVTSF